MSLTRGRSLSLLMIVAFLAFISIGLPDAVLGVAWPSMRGTFGLPLANLGFILFASSAGYFTSGLLAGRAIERLGVGRLLTFSTAGVAVGLFGYAISPAFPLVLLAAVCIGFGSGAVDTGLNFYAAKHFSVTIMNWLHAFFSFGAMVGPFIMAAVLAGGATWRWGYVIVASIATSLAVVFALTRERWTDDTPADTESQPHMSMRVVAGQPLVWLQILTFFVMTGIEFNAGSWAFTVLTERYDVAEGRGGIIVGLYWGSLAVGRILLGLLSRRVEAPQLVRLGTIGCLLGGAIMVIDQVDAFTIGLCLFGFSMAPLFPTLMSLTPRRLGSRVAMHAIGFQVSAAVVGGAVIPSIAGIVSQSTSLAAIAWTTFIGAIVLFGLNWTLGRLTEGRPAPVPGT